MVVARPKLTIGPGDHGRPMTLRDFEFAEFENGCVAELSRGYVVVGEVPNYGHAMLVYAITRHLAAYDVSNPGVIHAVLDGASSKLVIAAWESERHPDVSVYLSAPTGKTDRGLWRRWIPDIVIEVVSTGSDARDYTEKRDEYWTFGVKEYWIVDVARQRLLLLRRGRSRWIETILGAEDVVETKLLSGFQMPLGPLMALREAE